MKILMTVYCILDNLLLCRTSIKNACGLPGKLFESLEFYIYSEQQNCLTLYFVHDYKIAYKIKKKWAAVLSCFKHVLFSLKCHVCYRF